MKQQIDAYLNHLAVEKGFSGNTIMAYRNDLYSLQQHLEAKGRSDWRGVSSDHLADFVLTLQEKGYSQTTRARKTAAVRSFFAFLVDDRHIENSPAVELSSPKIGRSLPTALTQDEIEQLLEAPMAVDTPESRRDKAMLELLYATGMRVSELVSLRVGDVNLSGGFVRCIGKGNKERLIPFHEQALDSLEFYIEEGRDAFLDRNSKEDALFLNRRGEQLTRQGFLAHPERVRAQGGHHQPGDAPHPAPQLCHPHAARRGLPAPGAGVPGPRQHREHADLHPPHGRPPAGTVRGGPPPGQVGSAPFDRLRASGG